MIRIISEESGKKRREMERESILKRPVCAKSGAC